MTIELTAVPKEQKEVLRNLLEKYEYEFSQYDLLDVNELGLFGYDYLDPYWTEDGRHPFFIRVDGKLAGFAMVNDYFELRKDGQYAMAEFCVLYKYRRLGVGRIAAKELFSRFPGRWELKYHPKNEASAAFWNVVVGEVTGGAYKAVSSMEAAYPDGTPGMVLLFDV